jgi:type IV pilus assembly protein PilM
MTKLMLQLFRPPTPAIGFDLGSESVKMLQLAVSADGLRVAAALRVGIPDNVKGNPDRRVSFAGETLRAALRQRVFHGRRVIAALPNELVHYKTHRLPPMAPEDLPQAARIDARELFRFDPNSADVQCLDAGEVRQGNDQRHEVILVAAGKQYIDEFVLALHRAGSRLASLDIDPCAVWRAAQRVRCESDATHPRIILDVGAAQTRLIIGSGDTIRSIKTMAVGADRLRTAISRKLGLSIPEVEQLRRRSASAGPEKLDGVRKVLSEATRHLTELLAREVLAAVRYHAVTFHGPGARRIELTGGEAKDPLIRSTLAATLLLPAKPVDLFRGIDTSAIPAADSTTNMGEWAVALGLALKGITPMTPAPAVTEGNGVTSQKAAAVPWPLQPVGGAA